jgi:hypothetical protein
MALVIREIFMREMVKTYELDTMASPSSLSEDGIR